MKRRRRRKKKKKIFSERAFHLVSSPNPWNLDHSYSDQFPVRSVSVGIRRRPAPRSIALWIHF
jgi:hypothetical protein